MKTLISILVVISLVSCVSKNVENKKYEDVSNLLREDETTKGIEEEQQKSAEIKQIDNNEQSKKRKKIDINLFFLMV